MLSRRDFLAFTSLNAALSGCGGGASSVVAAPKLDIICWGDSMTAGAGGNGISFSNALQDLISSSGVNLKVRNAGVGGESSVTIATRAGAYPFLLSAEGNLIPSQGAVVVRIAQNYGYDVRPLLQGTGTPGTEFIGNLAGIRGILKLVKPSGGYVWSESNYYIFERLVPGEPVSTFEGMPFVTEFSEDRRGDAAIIWIGQNGPSNRQTISDAKAIINHLSYSDKKYLILSKPGGTSAQDQDDAEFLGEFKDRFISSRQYMVGYGLTSAGLIPTPQDLIDIQAGRVPSSLRVDSVHWTATGYKLLANLIFSKIKNMGWI